MAKHKSIIPGFSWRRALGISSVKSKIARATGIPTTKSGRKRKLQSHLWTAVAAGTCAAASQQQASPAPANPSDTPAQTAPPRKPFCKRFVFWLVAFILFANLYRGVDAIITKHRQASAVYKPGDKIMTLTPAESSATPPASPSANAPIEDTYYTEAEQAEAAAKYYESIGGNPYGGDGTAYSDSVASYDAGADTEDSATYILNTDTMVFHRSGCASAEQIAAANRSTAFGTRSDMLAKGYSACGRCHP